MGGRGGLISCMSHSRVTIAIRPSTPYNAGTELIGFSPNRQASRATTQNNTAAAQYATRRGGSGGVGGRDCSIGCGGGCDGWGIYLGVRPSVLLVNPSSVSL